LVRSRAESPCRAWDSVPQTAAGRSAKGELKNSLVDCFSRGNALQERAFPYSYLFNTQSTRDAVSGLCQRVSKPFGNPILVLYSINIYCYAYFALDIFGVLLYTVFIN